MPRYRTIRSPAVLPDSIGWSTATILVCLPAAFCPRDTLSPKFPSLGLQLRDVSLQTVVGWKPDRGLYGSGLLSFEAAGERAYLEHESYEQRRAERERRKDEACDTKARSNKCKMNGQMSVEAVSS